MKKPRKNAKPRKPKRVKKPAPIYRWVGAVVNLKAEMAQPLRK